MKHLLPGILPIIFVVAMFWQCSTQPPAEAKKVRQPVDTVGFAHTARQMDSVINRIDRAYGRERGNILQIKEIGPETAWQLVICPHDDYSYAGNVYPYVLKNLSAPTVILFGVAHKARLLNIEDKIVFDSFTHWQGPYGEIPVSPVREEIMAGLSPDLFMVSDSLQQMEHSVEALLPFLQYYHRPLEIVSILVPYMNFDRMQQISDSLARAIGQVAQQHQWKWGKDFAFAISNDCVHYGDEDWGGKNYAPYGADSAGYKQATNHDMTIISECLIDQIDPQKVKRFIQYTVKPDNYKEYTWPWCGRYSIPLGLLTTNYLQRQYGGQEVSGEMLRYATSISHPHIPVADLGMGVTAPANIHHWVGYVAIGYRY